MPDCRTVTALASRALEEPLPLGDRARVRWHLLACSGCRAFRTQAGLLRDAARRFASGDFSEADAAPPGESSRR